MTPIVKYFEHDATGRLIVYRAIENETILWETSGYDFSNVEGYSELTSQEYNSAMEAIRAERVRKNEDTVEKQGIINNLIDNADSLLGGIIGGILK